MGDAAAQLAAEEEYKKLREAFVSDHYGGSVLEINQVTFIAPAAILLWSFLQARTKFFDPYTPLACLTDFLLNVAALLFALTIYSQNPMILHGLLLVPVLTRYLNTQGTNDNRKVPKKPSATGTKDDKVNLEVIDTLPVKPFITHYRGAMLVVTCLCILAVDFPVFPRRFAKTESLGTSVMDLGVGSFVFSAGVVSIRQQLKEENGDAPRISFIIRFINSFKHALPLVVLGLIRLYTVKKLDYAEHVTEYGVHWNFFFTLSVIPPFVALLNPLFRLVPSYAIIGYAVSLISETTWNFSSLPSWIAFAPRDNIWAANKEGLVSIPGYLAIFLAGQGLGMAILPRDQDPEAVEAENDLWLAETLGGGEKVKEMKRSHRQFAWINLAKYSVIWCVVYQASTGFYGPRLVVSRRFANMAYFLWVSAFNSVILWIFCTVESLFFPDLYQARHKSVEMERVKHATSGILAAYNRCGLTIFLVANLLTGLVNMRMRTIEMNDLPAMVVLISYAAVVTGTALVLDHYKLYLKI